jgi:alpha-tubulin suppressor-like RCC1 family protein
VTSGARVLALLLLAAGACERPTAPTQLVYADRPVVVPAAALGWSSVTVGGAHTCAIRLDGTLYCWGANTSAQLGVGSARGSCGRGKSACEASPRAVFSTMRFTAVSAGRGHTCAIASDRSLFCWGENLQFETAAEGVSFVNTPQPVLPGVQFLDVSAGGTHSCAVRTNGVVYCWGEGNLGALGRGDTVSSVKPAPILSSERFTRVRSGTWRSCGIALDGAAWCWGSEWDSNESGVDYFHQRLLPHRISGLPPLRDISVSTLTTCAVAVDGTSYCWEANGFAQLGNGTTTPTGVPSPVLTGARFSSVSAGIIQSCGLGDDGLALCWGNNSFGQLGVPRPGEQCGDARLECSRTPIAVFGEQYFTSVVTGFGNHSCGVTTATALLCWGLGSNGQLGDGYTRDRQSLPVAVLPPQP